MRKHKGAVRDASQSPGQDKAQQCSTAQSYSKHNRVYQHNHLCYTTYHCPESPCQCASVLKRPCTGSPSTEKSQHAYTARSAQANGTGVATVQQAVDWTCSVVSTGQAHGTCSAFGAQPCPVALCVEVAPCCSVSMCSYVLSGRARDPALQA